MVFQLSEYNTCNIFSEVHMLDKISNNKDVERRKISCDIDIDTFRRLVELSNKTQRSKSFYVRMALRNHLSEMELEYKNHSIENKA